MARATAAQTIKGLGTEIETLRLEKYELERRSIQQQDLIQKRAVERDQLHDQILVLESDRDRLTAALDVCSRRLAQPSADKDASRGGWRYSNKPAASRGGESPSDDLKGFLHRG